MKRFLGFLLLLLLIGIGLSENPTTLSSRHLSLYGHANALKAEDLSDPSFAEEPVTKKTAFFEPAIIALPFMLFLVLLLVPFGPGVVELLKPKDSVPLGIDMNYIKDPHYFDRSARALLKKALMEPELPQGMWQIELSKRELTEFVGSKRIPSQGNINHVLCVKGNLESGNEVVFAKEVFVNGDACIGENNLLRTLACSGNILLSRATKIKRWIKAESTIGTQEGCDLGISASCKGTLSIGNNCNFKRLYGNPITIVTGVRGREIQDFKAANPLYETNEMANVSWEIVKKHVSINVSPPHEGEKIMRGKSNVGEWEDDENQKWLITSKYISIPSFTSVKRNFVVRKKLMVGESCMILGSIKAYEDVFIENDAVIYGNIFAEGNISIGHNCVLLGNVFSQGRITISSGTTVGKSKGTKSVVGKKDIELSKDITIHGYVLTEGVGNIL